MILMPVEEESHSNRFKYTLSIKIPNTNGVRSFGRNYVSLRMTELG